MRLFMQKLWWIVYYYIHLSNLLYIFFLLPEETLLDIKILSKSKSFLKNSIFIVMKVIFSNFNITKRYNFFRIFICDNKVLCFKYIFSVKSVFVNKFMASSLLMYLKMNSLIISFNRSNSNILKTHSFLALVIATIAYFWLKFKFFLQQISNNTLTWTIHFVNISSFELSYSNIYTNIYVITLVGSFHCLLGKQP